MNAVPWNPRPYQEVALQWLVERPHCGLLLDPGLGKTSTTLAAVQLLKDGEYIHHTLVTAPLRVAKTVWPVEAAKWEDFKGMSVCDLTELSREARIMMLRKGYDIYVINPESLVKVLELDPWLYLELDMLVIDESTKFKDSQTIRFKALKKLLHKFKRRIILTGTPAPNGLADLFGQMYVCDGGVALGKYITHFRQRYMHQSYDGFTWMMNQGADKDIYEAVEGKLLRLMAKDHLDMPELINNYIPIKLPPPVYAKYKELEHNFLVKLGEQTVAVFNTAALGVKLRQVCNGFLYDEEHLAHPVHTEKLEALAELVEEMQGRPLLVCYEFIHDREAIMEAFPQAVDIGQVKNTAYVVQQFNEGKIPLMIGHPRSMGHGLNLQEACKDICWFGITWDLELYQQAIARIWRQGQMAPIVSVHHFVAENTKDEDVVAALAGKDRTQNRLNDAIKRIVPRE
jgi:SNF2 family DNA or RNA helicase